MTTLAASSLLEQLNWRYATKKFDATRKIPPTEWAALEDALVLAPSSFGLQPWKFVVVTDRALRQQLTPHAWGQSQVADCSHYVVCAAKKSVTEDDIDRFVARIAAVRATPKEGLDPYRQMMVKSLVKGPAAARIQEWTARQVYIALGQFMAAAAVLGIDTCPMEGIDPAKFDEVLGLTGTDFQTVVTCAAGYRATDDKYAAARKVRFEKSAVIEHR